MLRHVQVHELDAIMQQVAEGAARKAFKPVGIIQASGPRLVPDAMTVSMSYGTSGCFYNIDAAPACRRLDLGTSANGTNLVLVGVPDTCGLARYAVRDPWTCSGKHTYLRGDAVVFSSADYTDARRIYSVESPLHGEDLQDFLRMLCMCNNMQLPPVEARPGLVPASIAELDRMTRAVCVKWYA